jgi:hypothetical protein
MICPLHGECGGIIHFTRGIGKQISSASAPQLPNRLAPRALDKTDDAAFL